MEEKDIVPVTDDEFFKLTKEKSKADFFIKLLYPTHPNILSESEQGISNHLKVNTNFYLHKKAKKLVNLIYSKNPANKAGFVSNHLLQFLNFNTADCAELKDKLSIIFSNILLYKKSSTVRNNIKETLLLLADNIYRIDILFDIIVMPKDINNYLLVKIKTTKSLKLHLKTLLNFEKELLTGSSSYYIYIGSSIKYIKSLFAELNKAYEYRQLKTEELLNKK